MFLSTMSTHFKAVDLLAVLFPNGFVAFFAAKTRVVDVHTRRLAEGALKGSGFVTFRFCTDFSGFIGFRKRDQKEGALFGAGSNDDEATL